MTEIERGELVKRLQELIGQYWEIAYEEGKTQSPQGDRANYVLNKINDTIAALTAQPAQEPVAVVGTQQDIWRCCNGEWVPPGSPKKVIHMLRDLSIGTDLYTTPPSGVREGVLAEFDAAIAAELPRVSTVQYNSHEICKHFAGNVRERILAFTRAAGQVNAEGHFFCKQWAFTGDRKCNTQCQDCSVAPSAPPSAPQTVRVPVSKLTIGDCYRFGIDIAAVRAAQGLPEEVNRVVCGRCGLPEMVRGSDYDLLRAHAAGLQADARRWRYGVEHGFPRKRLPEHTGTVLDFWAYKVKGHNGQFASAELAIDAAIDQAEGGE